MSQPHRKLLRELADAGGRLTGSPVVPSKVIDTAKSLTQDSAWRTLAQSYDDQDEFVTRVREACVQQMELAAQHRDQIVEILYEIWSILRASKLAGSRTEQSHPSTETICTERRVLWADDHGPDRLLNEKRILESAGWEVHFANSVREGAKRMSNESFRLVLLDQDLPILGTAREFPTPVGGALLLRWMRGSELVHPHSRDALPFLASPPAASNKHALVIVVSAYHDSTIERSLRTSSAMDADIQFLSKPIDIWKFKDAIQLASPD